MSIRKVMESNGVSNPAFGAAAPLTDKRTTAIANAILTLPNPTAGSAAIKSPQLLNKEQSAFDSLKNHIESTLGNNPSPQDMLALLSAIDEFKSVHGDRFENEVKLQRTSIITAIHKLIKNTFESLDARVKAITNNPYNYTVNDAITTHSEILDFYANYDNLFSKESRKKIIALGVQIQLVAVESFGRELKEVFDSLKSKVNSFAAISEDDHALAIRKIKAEINKFRNFIIETEAQKMIDDLNSFRNLNQDLHTQLNELSSSCTHDHELTDRLIKEELTF